MMKATSYFPLLCCLFATSLSSQSNIQQSLSINSSGAAPDGSAMLDVSANNKGVLVPRMTSGERTAITSPASGLLVFDTTTGTFWFYNGAAWIKIAPQTMLTDADNDTKIQVEESPDEDVIRFDLGGTENMVLRRNTAGAPRLELPDASNNLFIGKDAGSANVTGSSNAAYGANALFSNTSGLCNTAIGRDALHNNTTGFSNVAIGHGALYSNTARFNLVAVGDSALFNNGIGTTGSLGAKRNTALGSKALYSNTSGFDNTASGYQVLYSNTSGFSNTASGYQALYFNTDGNSNTASGYHALYSNTNGSYNTTMGFLALKNNTVGEYNTAFGAVALLNNTSGNFNTANGEGAMYNNTSGSNNTASGHQALVHNTTGSNNTAIGYQALEDNTTGDDNTATGYQALEDNTTGFDNTVCGIRSLQLNSTGYRNTAFGRSTGSFNDNNIHCTFIGYDADQTTTTDFDNSTALGSFSRITASNQVRIGNTNVTSIGGFADWTDVSDGRFKKNLLEDVPGLSFILALRPVTYNLDIQGMASHLQEDRMEDVEKGGKAPRHPDASTLESREAKSQIRSTGFVAQEVEQAAQSIGYDFNGVDKPQSEEGLYGLRYAKFVMPLVKAVQELKAEIEKFEKLRKLEKLEVEELKGEIAALKAQLEAEKGANAARLDKITAALQGAGMAVEK